MDRKKIDPNYISLSRRTFDPTSPVYATNKRRTVISDIMPRNPVKVAFSPQTVAAGNTLSTPVPHFRPQDMPLNLDEDIPIKNIEHIKSADKEKIKINWPFTAILLSDFALLAFSYFNKARFHHPYTLVLIINCLLAIGIYAKGRLNRLSIILFQFPLLLITIAMIALFTYNFINTNKIYHQNYIEIKNESSKMSFEQRQSLATYQYTTIFDRNEYISDSKIFYSLAGLQIIQSVTATTILIKRKR